MRHKYIDIANLVTADVFGVDEASGDVDKANKVLSDLYTQLVDVKTFLYSTGKHHECDMWLKRFHNKYPDVKSLIRKNLELEEV